MNGPGEGGRTRTGNGRECERASERDAGNFGDDRESGEERRGAERAPSLKSGKQTRQRAGRKQSTRERDAARRPVPSSPSRRRSPVAVAATTGNAAATGVPLRLGLSK